MTAHDNAACCRENMTIKRSAVTHVDCPVFVLSTQYIL
uniref:Uncharacterized protein n=1 Tax=Anguilla anguilla TaxID=7936 RepID=A0A0E9PUI7_ANGAN